MWTFFAVIGFLASIFTLASFLTGKANIHELIAYNAFVVRPRQTRQVGNVFDRNQYFAAPVQKSTIITISSSLSTNGKYFIGFDKDWYNPFSVYFSAFNFSNMELNVWRAFSIPAKCFNPYGDMSCCWCFDEEKVRLFYSRVSASWKLRIHEVSILDLNLRQQSTFEVYGYSGSVICRISSLEFEGGNLHLYFHEPVSRAYFGGFLIYEGPYTNWVGVEIDQDFKITTLMR